MRDSKIGIPGQDSGKTSFLKIKTQDDVFPRNDVSLGKISFPRIRTKMSFPKHNIIPQNQSENVIKTNTLAGITEVVLSLNKLSNSDNLEDGKSGNVLIGRHMTSFEELANFEPVTSRYKKLKEFTSIHLRIMDEKDNDITNGPWVTIVLHIR